MTRPANRARFCSALRRDQPQRRRVQGDTRPRGHGRDRVRLPVHVVQREPDGPGGPRHGQEPRHPGQPLDRGLTDLAHDDADQEEEHGGGREDAPLPPAADVVRSLADRANPPDQEQDHPGVGRCLGHERDAPRARFALAAGPWSAAPAAAPRSKTHRSPQPRGRSRDQSEKEHGATPFSASTRTNPSVTSVAMPDATVPALRSASGPRTIPAPAERCTRPAPSAKRMSPARPGLRVTRSVAGGLAGSARAALTADPPPQARSSMPARFRAGWRNCREGAQADLADAPQQRCTTPAGAGGWRTLAAIWDDPPGTLPVL